MTETPTMGAYLRAARRRRRVSIERAAEDTRIRPDYLMRMESDEFDFLSPTYVRGFLKTYSRFLRVDPDPLLQEFDRRFGTRIDTGPIVALERGGRKRPPREKPISSWAIAAVFAAVVLVALAAIGIVQGDNEEPEREPRLVEEEEPTPTPTPTPSATPTPTPDTPEDAFAFTEGIELEIVAANADCWVDVTTDGDNVFSDTMVMGESQTFTAEEDMDIVLGYAAGVELIVNGQNIGSPGIEDVFTFSLPDDIDSLL
jgi:cytoskeleton protein RodZ